MLFDTGDRSNQQNKAHLAQFRQYLRLLCNILLLFTTEQIEAITSDIWRDKAACLVLCPAF